MRISFLVSSLDGGGAERVAVLLSGAWAARGHDVVLMPTYSRRGGCAYALSPRVQLDYLADHVSGGAGRLRRLYAMRRYIRRTKPCVIVSFLPHVNVAALLAAVGTGVPVVVSERSYPPALQPPLPPAYRVLRRLTYPLASAVVVQSADTAEWARTACPGARPVVLPNPLAAVLPDGEPRLAPEAYLSSDRKLVLSAGRLDAGKRFGVLVSAFARVATEHPEWDLAVLGEGPDRAGLQAAAASLGLSDRIHFPGFAGNLGSWYARAAIYAMASSYEGFPNALVEAMAQGLPAVAFDVKTGPREIMEDGRCGVLLPDDDHVGRMAEALGTLMANEALRRQLGHDAAGVRQRYSLETVARSWERVLLNAACAADGSE